MEADIIAKIVVIVILVLLSAFFSSSETSLTAANKIRMRSLAEEKNKSAMMVIKLCEEPSKMLSTILIGNNIVNLTASSLTTIVAMRLSDGNEAVGIGTAILTVAVLLFGEITPKTLATKYADKYSLFVVNIIYPLTIVLTPVVFIVNIIAGVFLKMFGADPNKKEQVITENELLTILDVSHEEGVIEAEEHQMISNVVDFGDSFAKDVMVPRIDMTAIEVNEPYRELIKLFENDKYSRLPVYEETIDNIVGIISLKDVAFYKGKKEDFHISDYMRPPYFTYETKPTSELLKDLRNATHTIAIVLDEYGTTAGLLTIEDLVEEIIGEIRDEYDTDEVDNIQQCTDGEYDINGMTKIDEMNEMFGMDIETDDYDSIAGHVIYLLDRLPKVGDVVTDRRFTFTVTKMDKMKIEELHMVISSDVLWGNNDKSING